MNIRIFLCVFVVLGCSSNKNNDIKNNTGKSTGNKSVNIENIRPMDDARYESSGWQDTSAADVRFEQLDHMLDLNNKQQQTAVSIRINFRAKHQAIIEKYSRTTTIEMRAKMREELHENRNNARKTFMGILTESQLQKLENYKNDFIEGTTHL